jgi:Tol biopolymer transport system component/DNA-binding winged helix-turn-helix (wHTH) protein
MSSPNSDLYEFGPYRLDVRGRAFSRGEQAVPLAPKTFELLLLMLRNRGRALSKQELMTALWPGTFVEEANLSFQISTLRKALGKDGARWIETVPKHGYRFAGDANPVLTPAVDSSVQRPAPGEAAVAGRSARNLWITGAALVLVGLMSYVALGRHRTVTGEARAMMAIPLTAYEGFEVSPTLSPDGTQVAFSWNGSSEDNCDIYVKLVGPGEPHRLTSDPARDDFPSWSPDGQWIAFQRVTGGPTADVFVIPALGGAERKVATINVQRHRINSPGGFGLSWTPDGKWIAVGGGRSEEDPRGIWLIGVDQPEVRRLTQTTDDDLGDWTPTVSPDGRHVAFVRQRTIGGSAVYVLRLTSDFHPAGTPTRVTRQSAVVYGLAWAPDSGSVIFAGGGHMGLSHLYRVGLARAANDGPSEVLPFGERATSLAISRTGRLVYSARLRDANIWKIPLTGEPSTPTQVASSTLDEETPAYSPDGKRLAFASTRTGTEEIWVANSDGSNPVQVTFTAGPQCSNPQWSGDGRILFNSRRDGQADLYILNPHSGDLRRLTDDPAEDAEPRWSRDGRTIYFGSNRTGRFEVWKMGAEGGRPVQITKQGGLTATESPEGRFLYYAKYTGSPNEIWRVPVDGGDERLVVGGLSYSQNFVVADRGLYFLAVGAAPEKTSIDFLEFGTGRRTTLVRVGKWWWYGMAIAPDQQSLLYSVVDTAGTNLMVVEKFR